MVKIRCPRFGCNGIGLHMFLTAFGYRGTKVITFETALPASTTAANSNKFLTNVSKGNKKDCCGG